MTYIFFDFETTGIGDFTKQRAIQLCWIVTDNDLNIVRTESHYIKGNKELNTDFHKHLTLDILEEKGKELQWVLEKFVNDIKNLGEGKLVAHNISFDARILDNELKHCEIPFDIYSIKDKFFCTMKNSTHLTKIKRSHAGGYKYPKLVELYVFFYSKEPSLQLHDAENDTIVLLDCYKKLVKTMKKNENKEKKKKRKRDDRETISLKKQRTELNLELNKFIQELCPSGLYRIQSVSTNLPVERSREELLQDLDNLRSKIEQLPVLQNK